MMPVKLIPRAAPSGWMRVGAALLAALLMLVGGLVLFSLLGKDPLKSFEVFFLNPLKSSYGFAELLLKATPLMIIAMGLAIGFRANIWNIGAEGQFLMGAVGATAVVIYAPEQLNSFWMLALMMGAAMFCGALYAWIPALLRSEFNVNETLVSLMLVYVAQAFVAWLVHSPWQDPAGFNFPQSKMFSDNALLPILISGTRLNLSCIGALLVLVAGYLFMYRSFYGYQMLVVGQSQSVARYAGYSLRRIVWIGMIAGGLFAGLAGMTEAAGPVGQLTGHFGNNYGFAAIIVAFVGRLHPLGIFLASLLMALLYLGGEQIQQYLALPASIGMVFQGMLLFFLLGCDVLIYYRIIWVGFTRSVQPLS